jgi:hypothetical protein
MLSEVGINDCFWVFNYMYLLHILHNQKNMDFHPILKPKKGDLTKMPNPLNLTGAPRVIRTPDLRIRRQDP